MSNTSTRVNLAIPLEVAIQIEKDCDKRGIGRPQFIKEAIHEKLKNTESRTLKQEIDEIKNGIDEVRKILMLMLEVNQKKI
jgi:hypothetical protein